MGDVAELLRRCGPAIAAEGAPAEIVARAIADTRALWIYMDSCMGTREVEVSTAPIPKTQPAILLARKVPAELSRVGDPLWDYRDDALRALRIPIPKKRPDTLVAWNALIPDVQQRLLSDLQSIADQQAAKDHSAPGTIHQKPSVEVYSSEGNLTLGFVFDHMIWHAAQSGSDWYDHHVYVGRAEFAADVLQRSSTERRESHYLSEFDEPTYDPFVTRRHHLAQLRAAPPPRGRRG